MADENILAGMTAEQADEDIARREAKIEQLEATMKGAKDNLKAARAERKTFVVHGLSGTLVPPDQADKAAFRSGVGDTVEDTQAGAGAADARGDVG